MPGTTAQILSGGRTLTPALSGPTGRFPSRAPASPSANEVDDAEALIALSQAPTADIVASFPLYRRITTPPGTLRADGTRFPGINGSDPPAGPKGPGSPGARDGSWDNAPPRLLLAIQNVLNLRAIVAAAATMGNSTPERTNAAQQAINFATETVRLINDMMDDGEANASPEIKGLTAETAIDLQKVLEAARPLLESSDHRFAYFGAYAEATAFRAVFESSDRDPAGNAARFIEAARTFEILAIEADQQKRVDVMTKSATRAAFWHMSAAEQWEQLDRWEKVARSREEAEHALKETAHLSQEQDDLPGMITVAGLRVGNLEKLVDAYERTDPTRILLSLEFILANIEVLQEKLKEAKVQKHHLLRMEGLHAVMRSLFGRENERQRDWAAAAEQYDKAATEFQRIMGELLIGGGDRDFILFAAGNSIAMWDKAARNWREIAFFEKAAVDAIKASGTFSLLGNANRQADHAPEANEMFLQANVRSHEALNDLKAAEKWETIQRIVKVYERLVPPPAGITHHPLETFLRQPWNILMVLRGRVETVAKDTGRGAATESAELAELIEWIKPNLGWISEAHTGNPAFTFEIPLASSVN